MYIIRTCRSESKQKSPIWKISQLKPCCCCHGIGAGRILTHTETRSLHLKRTPINNSPQFKIKITTEIKIQTCDGLSRTVPSTKGAKPGKNRGGSILTLSKSAKDLVLRQGAISSSRRSPWQPVCSATWARMWHIKSRPRTTKTRFYGRRKTGVQVQRVDPFTFPV